MYSPQRGSSSTLQGKPHNQHISTKYYCYFIYILSIIIYSYIYNIYKTIVKIGTDMIINVSHQKGGTGKSTIAFNLAIALKLKGYTVTLVDTDIQNTVTSINTRLRENPLNYIIKVNDDTQLVECINNAKEEDIMIIDSGGFDSSLTRISIMGADINLTPLADQVTELLAAADKYSVILSEIEAEIGEKISTYIVLNKVHLFATKFEHIIELIDDEPSFNLLTRKIGDNENFIEIPILIRQRAIYNKSLIEGYGVCEPQSSDLAGHEEAKHEINTLADGLVKLHKNLNTKD